MLFRSLSVSPAHDASASQGARLRPIRPRGAGGEAHGTRSSQKAACSSGFTPSSSLRPARPQCGVAQFIDGRRRPAQRVGFRPQEELKGIWTSRTISVSTQALLSRSGFSQYTGGLFHGHGHLRRSGRDDWIEVGNLPKHGFVKRSSMKWQ